MLARPGLRGELNCSERNLTEKSTNRNDANRPLLLVLAGIQLAPYAGCDSSGTTITVSDQIKRPMDKRQLKRLSTK